MPGHRCRDLKHFLDHCWGRLVGLFRRGSDAVHTLFRVDMSSNENKAWFKNKPDTWRRAVQASFLLKKKKKKTKEVCFRQLSIFLIIVPICNQDFGLPRRLDYDIHNSLAVSLLLIQ